MRLHTLILNGGSSGEGEDTGTGEGEGEGTGAGAGEKELGSGTGDDQDQQIEDLIKAAEDAEEDEEVDASKLTEDDAKAAKKYTVKIDGEEVEVTLDELMKGYQRREDYTRKTQDLSNQRSEFDRQRQALYNSDAYKKLKQMAEADTGEFDPYNPDSFMKKMRQEVAQQLMEALAPAEQAMQMETARVKAKAFIDSKPEFKDAEFKSEVAAALKKDTGLTLENAYWIVKGRKSESQLAQEREEKEEHRRILREAGLSIGKGRGRPDSNSVPAHVRARGAFAIYQYLEAQQKERK